MLIRLNENKSQQLLIYLNVVFFLLTVLLVSSKNLLVKCTSVEYCEKHDIRHYIIIEDRSVQFDAKHYK